MLKLYPASNRAAPGPVGNLLVSLQGVSPAAPAAEEFSRSLVLPRLATAAASLFVQVMGGVPGASLVLGLSQEFSYFNWWLHTIPFLSSYH